MSTLACIAALALATPGSWAAPLSFAQSDTDIAAAGQDPLGSHDSAWSIEGGFAYQFNASLHDTADGRFSHGRAHLRARGRLSLRDDLDLIIGGRYQRDHFSFDNLVAPWNNVNTVRADAALEWKVDQRWTLFGGGMVQWAAESGASLGDGFEGGGAIGAVYGLSETLALGGGIGVQSRVLDDVLIYPIVVVDWEISDKLTFSTRLTNDWANQTGAQIAYTFDETWSAGVSAVFDYSRFRLNDDGPAAAQGGAGAVEALPVTLFLTMKIGQRASVSGFVGVMAYGRLTTTNTSQTQVWASDQGAAPVLGIHGSIRF